MKERLTRELRQKVADYHAYHGDKDVRIIRLIPDERGKLTGILVRIGDDVSTIDSEMFDYITELDSCNRAEEELMVSRYADGYANCEEGAQE